LVLLLPPNGADVRLFRSLALESGEC